MNKNVSNRTFLKLIAYSLFLLIVSASVCNAWTAVLMCIFAPAFVAYITCEFGITQACLLSTATVIFNTAVFLSADFGALLPSIAVALFSTVPGILFGIASKSKLKAFDTLLLLTSFVLILPIAILIYLRFFIKVNVSKIISDALTSTLSVQLETLKTVYPEISERLISGNDELISMVGIVIPGILPCLIISLCLIFSAFTFMICRISCKKCFVRMSVFPEGMDCIALPKVTVPIFGLAVIFSFLETENIVQMAASNMVAVILLLYMFEGISLIEYILKQRNMNSLLRLFAVLISFFVLTLFSAAIPILNAPLLAALLGISDCAADFRGIGREKEGIR